MPKIKRPNFGRYSWIPWYYFYPVWSSFISNTDVSTVGLILRRLRSNEVRPSPEMTKNIFLILKIWLITIEGIRSDTLDLTQVRIVVSRIKFFQTQKHDHIRPAIPPEVAPETGIRRPSGPVRNDPIHGPVRLVYLFALSSHRILIFSWPGPDRSVLVHPWPEVNRKLRFWNCMNQ